MTEFETIVCCILIPAFGAICYMAGKGDLLNLIPKMLLERSKEIDELQKAEETKFNKAIEDFNRRVEDGK